MYLYEEDDHPRENRTWVMIYEGGKMAKFIVPEIVNGEEYPNTLHNALWISMTSLEKFYYTSYERILNVDDVYPKEIVDKLPFQKISDVLIEY